MKLISLRYFITVAKCENITKASERLFVSQPTLSRTILELEKELGTKLFIRGHRSLKLTENGHRLLKEATEIVEHSDSLSDMFGGRNGQQKTTKIVKLAYQRFFSIQKLYPVFSQFMQDNPEYEILLECVEIPELKEGLEDGTFDAVFGLLPYFQKIKDLTIIPIAENRLKLIVSEKHPMAAETSVGIDRLEEENFILLNRKYSPAVVDYVIAQCVQNGFSPTASYYVDNIEEAIELVGVNKGISFAHSEMDILEQMNRQGVKLIDIAARKFDFVLAYREGHKNKKVLELMKQISMN